MNNSYLFVVLFAYAFHGIIGFIDAEPSDYYLSYCALFLAIAYICSLSSKKLILHYGILNILALWIHIPLIFSDFSISFYLFYDAKYSLGNWIIAMELLMIGFGSYNAIILFVNSWRDNGVSWYRHALRVLKRSFI